MCVMAGDRDSLGITERSNSRLGSDGGHTGCLSPVFVFPCYNQGIKVNSFTVLKAEMLKIG